MIFSSGCRDWKAPDRVPAAGTGYYDTLYVSGPGYRDSKAPRSSPGCRDRIQDANYLELDARLRSRVIIYSFCTALIVSAVRKNILCKVVIETNNNNIMSRRVQPGIKERDHLYRLMIRYFNCIYLNTRVFTTS